MVMMLIILFNYLLSFDEILKVYFNKLLKTYSKKHFHKLVSLNQYLCYIFFKNLYLQSITSFLPLIYKKLFKKKSSWFFYFYTPTNIKVFLFIHIISSLGLIFNKEIGLFIDYFLNITSLWELKECGDVVVDTDYLKKDVVHINLPDDPKISKSYKNMMQVVVICTTIGIIYLCIGSF